MIMLSNVSNFNLPQLYYPNRSLKVAFEAKNNPENSSVIYTSKPLSTEMLACFKANAISFGNNGGLEGVSVDIDPASGFDAHDLGDLFMLVGFPEGKRLLAKLVPLMKQMTDFKGKYLIQTIKEILNNPDKEELVDMLVLRKNNSPEDVIKTLELINKDNIDLIKELISKTDNSDYISPVEIRLITSEIKDNDQKKAVFKKLLTFPKVDVSGVRSIIHTFDTENPVHQEILDFLLNTDKDFWLLFLDQLLEKSTQQNKDAIKEIVNKAPGKGMDAAKYIMERVNKL